MEQQEQRLARRAQQEAEEHQAAVGRVEKLRVEEQHLHRRVTVSDNQPQTSLMFQPELLPVSCALEQELEEQQVALLSQRSAAACHLEEEEEKLAELRAELQTNRTGDRKPLAAPTAANQRAGLHRHTHCRYVVCVCVWQS